MRDRIVFRRDPVSVELVRDARRTLAAGEGDCDDKATLLASLLATYGHISRFVVGSYTPTDLDHVWLEVATDDGRWLPLDPSVNPSIQVMRPGDEFPLPYRAVWEIF